MCVCAGIAMSKPTELSAMERGNVPTHTACPARGSSKEWLVVTHTLAARRDLAPCNRGHLLFLHLLFLLFLLLILLLIGASLLGTAVGGLGQHPKAPDPSGGSVKSTPSRGSPSTL